MFRKKNKKEVIVDRSAMLRAPAHHPLHFLYALLLGLSFAGALWQYGQPQLTIGLLIAVIPCSLVVFIPYSIYPSMLRIVVTCLIFGRLNVVCILIIGLRLGFRLILHINARIVKRNLIK